MRVSSRIASSSPSSVSGYIEPFISSRITLVEAEKSGAAEREIRQRLGELLDFFQTSTAWYEQMRRLPNAALVKFMKLGARVQKLLGIG